MGGDEQMTGEQQANMKYDASRASLQYSYPQNPGYLWPYTYDYASIQDCVYGSCPMASYPGRLTLLGQKKYMFVSDLLSF